MSLGLNVNPTKRRKSSTQVNTGEFLKYNSNPFISVVLHTYNQGLVKYPLALYTLPTQYHRSNT